MIVTEQLVREVVTDLQYKGAVTSERDAVLVADALLTAARYHTGETT